MLSTPIVHVVGAGLAGCEVAWQLLRSGINVKLHEMRPVQMTKAHKTADFAELVCSNSLKSMAPGSAPGLLKKEMRALDSLILRSADIAQVPAGQALAVDRKVFSAAIDSELRSAPRLEVIVGEVQEIPSEEQLIAANEFWVIATGPLTTDAMAHSLNQLSGGDSRLYFYDAIAPVIAADSINLDECFSADRYGKGDPDYLNLPLDRDQYEAFIDAVINAEKMPLHSFEEVSYFESCLPIEVMIERGRETLRFGPMKPVGLVDPKTGRRPWANVQLRKETRDATMYSIVGFQTKMKWPAQKVVFSMLPGLAEAEFLRYGSVHRNTYLESPKVLNSDLSFRTNSRVYLAGQITGVEGYTESAAIGLIAGRLLAAKIRGENFSIPPVGTMLGALHGHVVHGGLGKFAPMNANLGLLPHIERNRRMSKVDRKLLQCENAESKFSDWKSSLKNASMPYEL
jgi:methylenetetrahydrofolate--tRNA-(uracil-5-)-methyltransferase